MTGGIEAGIDGGNVAGREGGRDGGLEGGREGGRDSRRVGEGHHAGRRRHARRGRHLAAGAGGAPGRARWGEPIARREDEDSTRSAAVPGCGSCGSCGSSPRSRRRPSSSRADAMRAKELFRRHAEITCIKGPVTRSTTGLVAQDRRRRVRSAPAERRLTGAQLVEHATEAAQTSLRSSARSCSICSGDVWRVGDGLGRIGGAAHVGPVRRDAEADDDDGPVAREAQLGRRQIAVDDPGGMSGGEALGRLHQIRHGRREDLRSALGDEATQVGPRHVLGGDPETAVLSPKPRTRATLAVDGRERADLADQPRARCSLPGKPALRLEDLDHHALAVLGPRHVTRRRSRRREPVLDEVRPDRGAGTDAGRRLIHDLAAYTASDEPRASRPQG